MNIEELKNKLETEQEKTRGFETTEKEKIEALKEFLKNEYEEEIKAEEITADTYNTNIFYYYNQEYLVLTDEEADEEAKKEVKGSLWAFNSDFIVEHSKIGYNERVIKILQNIQSELCEDCQELVEALIEDIDEFCEDALNEDGRGHFLADYDGVENQQNDFMIYRR